MVNQLKRVTSVDLLTAEPVTKWEYPHGEAAVIASKQEIVINKVHIGDYPSLKKFAEVLSDAWVEHERLRPKIYTTLAGH